MSSDSSSDNPLKNQESRDKVTLFSLNIQANTLVQEINKLENDLISQSEKLVFLKKRNSEINEHFSGKICNHLEKFFGDEDYKEKLKIERENKLQKIKFLVAENQELQEQLNSKYQEQANIQVAIERESIARQEKQHRLDKRKIELDKIIGGYLRDINLISR